MTDPQIRRRSEVRALARLALDEIGAAAGGIGSIHRAVSDRVFAGVRLGVGTHALPAKALHDEISAAVYALVAGTARLGGSLAGQFLDVPSAENVPPSQTPGGARAIAAIQGLIGDVLESEGSVLAEPLAIRVGGVALTADEPTLANAFPHARGRIVVFLHGLVETEDAWSLGRRPTYGERLETDLGYTALQIRYNSGRHISDNGRSLSDLLDAVTGHWPVEVESIALVGHSMGGLVARSACRIAFLDDRPWVRRVRQVVSLGSPHLGAPLEQAVHYASAGLAALPETRAISGLLRRRSAGIRDLNQGSLVDEDWRGRDPDALRAAAISEVPLLDGVTYCFVSATITRSPRHPLGRLLGDGMVLVPSASGRNRTRMIGFRDEDGMHLAPANHFTMLNHESVYEKLLEWLGAPEAG
ncbi:triacylglycerol lipase [Rhodococcus sp. NCIMB 12038]|uniref:esterase/lipase family protein n=1 Tax=Rhodococcus sp. NCIMB 12038 TaxID=933800 RepID=UPI000B3C49A7|nr:alpha/beta fold hydrolase [Rhodococcus sp. NCIMB 12038]OUS95992.1 alpha/beta hydrolase [Rhodococcus sp. NCIMB 12038]